MPLAGVTQVYLDRSSFLHRIVISDSLKQNPCLLSTTELRRLHRRFGHSSADRLHRLLERSGHEDIEK
jgi:hypothetical protein